MESCKLFLSDYFLILIGQEYKPKPKTKDMQTKLREFNVQNIFTPAQPASLTYVERKSADKQLTRALLTPGKQLIIYGHSGAGKTTIIQKKLVDLSLGHVTTRCMGGITLTDVIIDAFNQLDVYYSKSNESKDNKGIGGELSASYLGIKASIKSDLSTSKSSVKSRAVDLPITPQTLAKYFGEANYCWVIEDFHKMPEEEKVKLSQIMKVFMDMSIDYPNLKIIALGAVNTARQVVQYDPEMKNRVSEIYVPLMSENELKGILDKGCKLLNINFSRDVREKIIIYSSGLAAVTHQLSLLTCIEREVYKTVNPKIVIDKEILEAAINEYLKENSDSYKGTFDLATKINKTRKYESPEEILKAILVYERKESVTVRDITEIIQKKQVNYRPTNLRKYIDELTTTERGEILRHDKDSDTFSFSNPFIRAFTHLKFRKKVGEELFNKDRLIEDLKTTLENEMIAAQAQFLQDINFDEFD